MRVMFPAVAAMLVAAPSFAGGLTEPEFEPVVVAQMPAVAAGNWTGAYGGVFLGYGDDDTRVIDDHGVSPQTQPNPTGGLAGVSLGYNFQSGRVVYGIEGDIALGKLEGTGHTGHVDYNAEVNSLATLRGRVGYDGGRWMPYVTAGFAAADVDYSLSTDGAATSRDSDTATGWVAGVGVDYAISDRWVLNAEYRYMELDGRFDGLHEPADMTNRVQTIKLGANFRF